MKLLKDKKLFTNDALKLIIHKLNIDIGHVLQRKDIFANLICERFIAGGITAEKMSSVLTKERVKDKTTAAAIIDMIEEEAQKESASSD